MPADKKRVPNKLLNETSPYLLQHAHNPVDWYPWGDEAFEKARREDRPVFLSIGYSTCHWCHVMAHESFEDKEVAQILNAGFVSVKVDREERPDIDEVYMSVCQALTGSGGWPLTVIMSADKMPFFAGTYLPKNTAYGRMGLIELLAKVMVMWQKDRGSLTQNREKIRVFFDQTDETRADVAADSRKILNKAYEYISSLFDGEYGGFSVSPKFPTPHYLLYLLHYWKAYDKKDALLMVEKTLGHMYRGGIFDHIGYGFSRYSTDSKWLVPHFEKMLYDNAMLLLAYTDAYAATGNAEYHGVAQKIATYLLRDMRSPDGGFYSAEDADSEGVEGKYYVWDYRELKNELTEDELCFLEARYGVKNGGNFEGKNILNLIDARLEGGELETAVIKKLYSMRDKRVRPFRDEKISASWNGLAIEALVFAGVFFDEPVYIAAARNAADFILSEMTGKDGTLYGTYKDGRRSKAFLADYANAANALIALYTATLEMGYIDKAVSLVKDMIRLFWDEAEKRFYMTPKGDEALFMRPRDDYDGAMPSGNSSAVMCLVRLFNLKGDADIKKTLDNAIKGFVPKADLSPGAHMHFLSAMMTYTMPHRQVVIASDRDNQNTMDAYMAINHAYLPFTTVIYYDKSAEMDKVFPELAQYKTDAAFSAYVCENFTCKRPIHTSIELKKELGL
ncbi:MAG: thioredoxin domain-containing protein [Eubacteriales bacterium]|nr:thioredoxin domain-containing protein [Eubacteriales bacterium]